MAIRIPQNQIKKELYTSGGEFLIAKTQQRYKGYYYEANGKFYAGKEYKNDSPELIKSTSDKVNNLLSNPFTNLYGAISQIKLNNTSFNSSPFNPTNEDLARGYTMRYFIKKTNVNNPIIIKEINKDTFDSFKDPLYQTLEVKYNLNITDKELEELDKKMPGLKRFLQDYAPPTSSDENNPFIK